MILISADDLHPESVAVTAVVVFSQLCTSHISYRGIFEMLSTF